MMKKVFTLTVFLTGLFFLSGCAQASGGGGGTKVAVDKSLIAIYCTMEPLDFNTSGPAVYQAYCQISAPAGSVFNNATVCINSSVLSKSTFANNYYKSENTGSFSAGDTVVLTITDSELGLIQLTSIIPASLTDVTITPAMPADGTANTQLSYELSWTAVPSITGYSYMSYHYSNTTNEIDMGYGGSGDSITTTSQTLYTREYNPSDSSYTAYPWIGLSLNTENSQGIPNFKSYSVFRVRGSKNILKTN